MIETLQTEEEIKNLLYFAYTVREIEGDYVEVGVYKGGSAKVIHSVVPESKDLYLHDTFSGFTEDNSISSQFDFKGSFELVHGMFIDEPNVFVYKGKFPQLDIDTTYSFAHIDVDLPQATREALEHIYPRLTKGGVILLHDYLNPALGVRKACDDFFSNKGEKVIHLGTSQGYIVKQ